MTQHFKHVLFTIRMLLSPTLPTMCLVPIKKLKILNILQFYFQTLLRHCQIKDKMNAL